MIFYSTHYLEHKACFEQSGPVLHPGYHSTLGILYSRDTSLSISCPFLTEQFFFFCGGGGMGGEPTETLYTNVLTKELGTTPFSVPFFYLYPRGIVYLRDLRSFPEIDSPCPHQVSSLYTATSYRVLQVLSFI